MDFGFPIHLDSKQCNAKKPGFEPTSFHMEFPYSTD